MTRSILIFGLLMLAGCGGPPETVTCTTNLGEETCHLDSDGHPPEYTCLADGVVSTCRGDPDVDTELSCFWCEAEDACDVYVCFL